MNPLKINDNSNILMWSHIPLYHYFKQYERNSNSPNNYYVENGGEEVFAFGNFSNAEPVQMYMSAFFDLIKSKWMCSIKVPQGSPILYRFIVDGIV